MEPNYRSKEYQVDRSMILQNSKADVNLEGISDDQMNSMIKNTQAKDPTQLESSQINSKVFSISPDQDSFSPKPEEIDEKENIMNGTRK